MAAVYFLALVGVCTILYLLIAGLMRYRYRMPSLSLILLVKNREGDIEGIIRKLLLLREMRQGPLEIVAVNDGSQDLTGEILTRLALQYEGLIHINRRLYPDQISPVELGQRFCSGEVSVIFDLSRYTEMREAARALDSLLLTGHVI